jgi:hypothetical protein
MRTIFFAMLLACGVGVAGIGNSSAAPVAGAGLLTALQDMSSIAQVRSRRVCEHWRHSARRCWHR